MNDDDCISCYAKLLIHTPGELVEICHKCLVCKYEIVQIDWVNELLEDYEFDIGFCEKCRNDCQTTKVKLCNEHFL